MTSMKNLISQEPMTFNELLDLFEAYVSTIGDPLNKAVNLITNELDYHSGDIFSHIVGVVDDAHEISKRVKQIRAARNIGTDVSITLTEIEHRQLDTAIPDVICLLGDMARTLDLLSVGFDSGNIDPDQPAIGAMLRLLSRALQGADQVEIPVLTMANHKIRKAVGVKRVAERQAEVQVGETA